MINLFKMTVTNTVSPSVKFGLHFAGIWPGTPFPHLHKIGWVIAMTVFQAYQYRYVVMHFQSDTLMDRIDNLSICLPFTLVFIKLLITWTNYDEFCGILLSMEEDCRKYAMIDGSNLILKTGQFSFYLTSMIMSSYMVAAAFYITGTLAFQEKNDTVPRELLFKMDLPFEANESPNYELVVTTQFLIHLFATFTFGTYSALLLMVILHVGCQIDIMCRNIVDIPQKSKKELKFFIIRYQEIIVMTQKIEKVFRYIALSQLVSNTLTTCCEGFLIVIAVNDDNGLPMLIKCVLFYAVMWLDAFLYCFAGEYLRIKSKLIGDTAYEILWYNLHPQESQLLIPLILRSQRGFTLTFGKFSNLSFENFTSITKISLSYISVLLAVY